MAKKNNKNKKLKKQIRDSFLLTVIICSIIYILYKIISLINSPTDTFILKESKISSEESKVGYVIRDEKVIESSDKKEVIEPIKNEGERVASGKPIFKYYNVNEEEISNKINELNKEIQEALLGRTDLLPSDVKAIEGQIENQMNNLKDENNMQDVLEYKSNMSDYIVKKAKIAGSLSSAGTYINNLITQRNELEKTLANGAQYICSDNSGVVSYRIDGLEEKLTLDSIENLTTEDLENLKLTTGQIVSKSTNKAKVINNFECYIAVSFDSEMAKQAKEGDKVTLRISNQEEVKASVYNVKEEGNKVLIIFRITDNVEKLINYRKISLDVIWWQNMGLRVPKSAILYENGVSYIIRNKNGNLEEILVKILEENENFCIIDNYDTEELIELGYTTEEIDNMKTVKLYDEIVADPEIE